ncbi:hypothetical protein JCM10908_004756 [Rhodotorula pacifica]|uniref:uncharacterized protein n=1 Tax=Rhodotorula pacifica TaxID=1495444 RepID=UPI00317D35B7
MAASTKEATRPAKEAIVLDSDTGESDVEVVETGETTPETHDDAEYKEPVAVDEEADRQAEQQTKVKDPAASSKPKDEKEAKKLLRKALLDVVRKTRIYTDAIEKGLKDHAAAQGLLEEEDETEPDAAAIKGGKKRGRRTSGNATPKKKPRKQDVPPLFLPQSKLITGGTLKNYQLDGQNWLIQRYIFAMHGAILADEMGTGKTLQSITLLAFIQEEIHKAEVKATDKPSIVILPKAVLYNWALELERFAPSLPVLVYTGNKDERAEIRRSRLGLRGLMNQPPRARKQPMPIILVTYQIMMNDINWLKELNYDAIICDEAHKAKGLNGRTLACLKQLKGDFRLLLTGTPLQNNLTELYALLSFILPNVFNDQELFESQFDFSEITTSDGSKLSEQEEVTLLVAQLQSILKPFLLRRCKKDVIKDLPLKKEYVLTAPLTARQKEMTEAAVKGDLRDFLSGNASAETKEASPSKRPRRKRGGDADIIDLSLLTDAEDNSTPRRRTRGARKSYVDALPDAADDDEFEEQLHERQEREALEEQRRALAKATAKASTATSLVHKKTKWNSAMTNLRQIANHPLQKYDDRAQNADPEDIVNLSGKMMLLDRVLPELFRRKHKVLLFSQFTTMLDLLDEYIELRGWDRYRIDGRGGHGADQDEINQFNTAPFSEDSANIFLLSTRAGGVGLNLIGADTVIIFDSDWNPQNDLQAMDRAHRIGQTKPVLVFRLASANTVEQTILASATKKRKLERVVLGNGTFRSTPSIERPADESARPDTYGGDAKDILNKAKGKKTGGTSRKKDDAMRQLAQQLLQAEGERISLADSGSEILTDEQLNTLLDRSDNAMKSVDSSEAQKGATFEVVETIEEETVQQTNILDDLLGEEGDPAASTANTTDDEE